MIEVFIVEDQELTRRSIQQRIEANSGFVVPVAVGTCEEIRNELSRRAPSVLLIDLGLPDGDGIDIIREAASRYPKLPIMVISIFDDEKRLVKALQAGATGYLLKDDDSQEIVAAIRQLLEGGSPMSPAIARRLIRILVDDPAQPSSEPTITLTAREHDVITLSAKGLSYCEIGKVLGLATSTVASYSRHIYEKLSVRSRSEAVFEASRLGLLEGGRPGRTDRSRQT